MEDVTYTKGLYTATVAIRPLDGGRYQGVVQLSRDEGEADHATEDTLYEVEASSASADEALEEARALAHRILGEIEF